MTKTLLSKAVYDFAFLIMVICISCSGGKNKSLAERASASGDYESEDVNAIQQALPTIMVLPSDNLLEEYNSLKTQTIDGRKFVLRDYQQYLLANNDNQQILSTVQGAFVDMNYPLNDLEQTLKQLNTQEATDMVDNLEKDSKTLLLATAQPDIILELDYKNKMDLASHNVNSRQLSYTLRAIDAYTNKVVATINESGVENSNVVETMQKSLEEILPKLSGDITKYFSDILTRGREVTVRVAVEKGSNIKLSDENVEGDTYSDWIVDYMNTHTTKGAYKLQRNTDNELYFVNVRIRLLNEDGTQHSVYDWTREFRSAIRKNLGVKATNKAQGLGEIMITISGL
jgi:hypothetical protein